MMFNKHFGKYYLKYAGFFIAGFLALIVVDYAQLYVPEFLGIIVDHLKTGDTSLAANFKDVMLCFRPNFIYAIFGGEIIEVSGVGSYIVATLIVAFVMCIGRMAWRFAVFYAVRKIESHIRHDMFKHAEMLSQNYYHENPVGNIMSWFTNDLDTVEEYMGWGFIMLIDAIFLSIFTIIKMVYLDVYKCGDYLLVTLTAIPVVLIIVWGIFCEKIMSNKWEQRQKEFDRLYDYSQESFTGIRVIKAFVKEAQEIRSFAKEAKRNQDANINFVKIAIMFDVLIELIIEVIIILIISLGAYLVINGTIKGGDLVTFIGYFDSLIWPMIALGQIVAMKSRAKASLKRIESFIEADVEIKNPLNAVIFDNVKGGIKFDHFTYQYPTKKSPILKDITLEIKPGEKVGIVGKIGSGKTSFANILLRMYNIEKDKVFIDGIDIMNADIKSLRKSIAYVPQDNFLFSDTVRNNIAFSDIDLDEDKVVEAAKFASVHDNIVEFTNGYQTILGERGVTMSGGQKQRVSIARAFIKDSPILILDDSVSAVDVKTEEEILENIEKYRKGKTTILIASRVSTVAKMDKIIVLKGGILEAFGSPEELMKTSKSFQKMVYLQTLEKEVEGGKN